ncbi:hypothetical protein F4861DRAFT_250962 [Xylaria intraflava]|nr:hypothetical protein F4861DRAFT_250962 [Xylaria intraflava]
MLAPTIMKLVTVLALPLAALAAPKSQASSPYSTAPFAPGSSEQGPYDKCTTEENHKGNFSHPADMLDCLQIGEWARANNGLWVLKATASDSDDWFVLRQAGNCALLAQNTVPTEVGNKDVTDLIDTIHLGDGISLGSIEELGTFGGCQGDATVNFWLRDSKF